MSAESQIASRVQRPAVHAWIRRGLLLLAAGVLTIAAIDPILGTPGSRVNVRWVKGLDEVERRHLEDVFQLQDGRLTEETTWTYDLADVSSSNIRALVSHAAVADTHHIDRGRYHVSVDAERTARRGGLVRTTGDQATLALRKVALVLASVGMFALAMAAARFRTWSRPIEQALDRLDALAANPVGALTRVAAFARHAVQRGIPEIDARAAGAFRVAFGVCLIVFVASSRVDSAWLANAQKTGPLHAVMLELLSRYPFVADYARPAAIVSGVLFTAGVVTRLSFRAFALAFSIWVSIYMAHRGIHSASALALAVVGLLAARWGDGLSVDEWMRHRRGASRLDARGKQYGYAVWVPVLVLALCFVAAAWAKLQSGTDWILNGSVAYHFVTDSPQAPVLWGLRIAQSYTLSVAMSAAAVITETLIIVAAFTTNGAVRLLLGVAAACLFAGFGLFQGVFWPSWWVLLLGFLPWERVKGPMTAPLSRRGFAVATTGQVVVGWLLVLQQGFVSWAQRDVAPFFSEYDMYSATFASREAYDRSPATYTLLANTGGGVRELHCPVEPGLAEAFTRTIAGDTVNRATIASAARWCAAGVADIHSVSLRIERMQFDWERARLDRRVTILGPVALDTVFE